MALIFIGIPFVIRTVQPVIEGLEQEVEEALDHTWCYKKTDLFHVLPPALFPAVMTGFSLAFARALGEYGSVVFIAGNIPFKTEITPLMIMSKLEQYDYQGAAAIACFIFALIICHFVIDSRIAVVCRAEKTSGSEVRRLERELLKEHRIKYRSPVTESKAVKSMLISVVYAF